MSYRKGFLIIEGKTKRLYEAVGHPDLAIFESKEDITAFDDPDFTKKFNSKAACATGTNANVCGLLNRKGLPTAFVEQLNDVEFLVKRGQMIKLEVIGRRYAVGGMLKRRQELAKPAGQEPYRFDPLHVEFDVKTTQGGLVVDGKTVIWGLNAKAGEEDPLIVNPYEAEWKLVHNKKPPDDPAYDLKRVVPSNLVVRSLEDIRVMENLLRRAYHVIEEAFLKLKHKLIDIKLEFAFINGQIVIADVVDNDSWRLRTELWEEISKQRFRDGEDMDEVERLYLRVAQLTEQFNLM